MSHHPPDADRFDFVIVDQPSHQPKVAFPWSEWHSYDRLVFNFSRYKKLPNGFCKKNRGQLAPSPALKSSTAQAFAAVKSFAT